MEQFIEYFSEILEETDKSTLSSETVFKDLDEWDSMAVLMLIAMFDDKYDKKINGGVIKEANTIGDLYGFLQK